MCLGIAQVQHLGKGSLRKDLWKTKDTQEESRHRPGAQDRRDRLGDVARRERLGTQANDRSHRIVRQDAGEAQGVTHQHEAKGEQRSTKGTPSPGSSPGEGRRRALYAQDSHIESPARPGVKLFNQSKQNYQTKDTHPQCEGITAFASLQTTASRKASIA